MATAKYIVVNDNNEWVATALTKRAAREAAFEHSPNIRCYIYRATLVDQGVPRTPITG